MIQNKKMFRGSAYSIETDKDLINKSQLLEQEIRIAMLGISEVGKTSMLACIANDKFRQNLNNTIDFQLRFMKLRMNQHAINLRIWDGAGDKMGMFLDQGRFDEMDGVLEVFDLTDKQSFHQLQHLHHQLKARYLQNGKLLCALLVGNKADQAASHPELVEVSKQIDYLADKFAKREQLLYLKTSAKKNSCVKDSYIELIKQILVTRSRGKTSRIFNEHEEIGMGSASNTQKGQQARCSCCKSLTSCNPCSIF